MNPEKKSGQTEPLPSSGGVDAARIAEMVARRSYGKLVAFLAARTRDVASAEDALADAFASALEDWSRNGCPENPEAWLLTVARRKTIDGVRRREHHDPPLGALALQARRQRSHHHRVAEPARTDNQQLHRAIQGQRSNISSR